MKKIFALAALMAAAYALPAHATVEKFDSARSAAADGFNLGSNIFFHDSGRPFLQLWDAPHIITADAPYTFQSIDLNYAPWQGFTRGSGSILNMVLLDINEKVLLDTFITLPSDREWVKYSNSIENVSSIYFAPANRFWPSFDNLTYTRPASDVPEPATIALVSCGLLGFALSRRKSAQHKSR